MFLFDYEIIIILINKGKSKVLKTDKKPNDVP